MSVGERKDQYVCIECLHKVDSIFKVYQDGFKDIIQCVNILQYSYLWAQINYYKQSIFNCIKAPLQWAGWLLHWMREVGCSHRFSSVQEASLRPYFAEWVHESMCVRILIQNVSSNPLLFYSNSSTSLRMLNCLRSL